MPSIILILIFLSGASGLVYEVVWQRVLNLVFGNTTFATATIVASFMGGLALGSFVFGRLADRFKKPLRLYAYLEFGIGLFALAFPFILSGITALYVSIQQQIATTFYLSSLMKFGLCFLVLIVPSFLMGGTLPVMGKFFVRKLEKLGRGVGGLYGFNTLGGVLGAFSAGFILINWLGVRGTTYAAIAVNILIAGLALGMDRYGLSDTAGETGPGKESDNNTDRPVYPGHTVRIILIVYALSGFCALAYEVLWTRILVFFLGNTTYVFTTMLTTFLLGLALGSLIFNRILDKGKHLLHFLALIEVFIGIFAILPLLGFHQYGDFVIDRYIASRGSWPALVGIRYLSSLIIMFIPTLLMGVAFPLVNKIYIGSLKDISHGIGNVYALNTLGNVVGSFAAGFVLIPFIGITKSILLVASINLALGAMVFLSSSASLIKHRLIWAASVAVVTVGVLVATIVSPGIVLQKVYPGDALAYYKEGSSATVAVKQTAYGDKQLIVNGHTEVPIDYQSLRAFHMLGHVPLLLHENPKGVLILAFGAGITSGAVAEHPVDRIDAVEISPEVIKANWYFGMENQDVMSDDRVNVMAEDARNYLLYTQKRYDVIISDSTHPTASDSWVLYTREFYELCEERLKPGGLMSQWLPLHGFAADDYRGVIKTFQTVFPYTTVWFTNEHSLVVGSTERLTIDFTLLTRRMQDARVKEDLEDYKLSDPFALLGHFVMGEESLKKYTQGVQINTDNQPFVQFAEARSKAEDPITQNLSGLFEYRESVFPLLTNMGDESQDIKAKVERYYKAWGHVFQGHISLSRKNLEGAIDEYRKARDINPEDGNTVALLEWAEALFNRINRRR